MATKTSLIGLIKPAFNEYKDSWYIPINKNWDTIDAELGAVIQSLSDSQGSMGSLKDRLDVALNADGSLKDIPEIQVARNSTVYGDNPSPAGADFALVDRLNEGDKEVFFARQGYAFQLSITLSSGFPTATTSSTAVLYPGMLISGTGVPTGTTIISIDSTTQITLSANATSSGAQTLTLYSNGKLIDGKANERDDFPSNCIQHAPSGYMTYTGAQVKIDGSASPIITDINGYRQVVRTLKSTTLSGTAGTYYIYLSRSATGEIILDRTVGGAGTTSTFSGDSKLHKFTETTQNFVTSGVRPGDLLEITNLSSPNKNVYVVSATTTENSSLATNELLVYGLFRSAQSGILTYKITNPVAPTLGFTSTAHSKRFQREPGKIFIGRAVFDGTNVTGVTAYTTKGRYEEWFSITLGGGNFTQAAMHKLGYVPSKIEIFGAQNADYSTAINPLSVAEATGGSTTLVRSVIAEVTDSVINVKNATNGIFYKDYSGSPQTTGFILVRAER